MKEPVWLDRLTVDAIHFDLLLGHGGMFGVRDEGLLESALDRARNRWLHEPESDLAALAALAAAYGIGLTTNHPFADGNKRVALMAMYVFLAVNGRRLVAPEAEAALVMLDVARGRLGEAELAAWLRRQTRPVKARG
jgi:death-on-curing protein